jgi:hypothetical protein
MWRAVAMNEVMVTLTTRAFTIDVDLEDDALIESIFNALTDYVGRGFTLKVRESYVTSLSDSLKIITKIISRTAQMDEWRSETKQLISLIRKGT